MLFLVLSDIVTNVWFNWVRITTVQLNLHIILDEIVKNALSTFLNNMQKNQTRTIKFKWTSIQPYFIDLNKANL
jgi:hypothetical protein